MRTLTHNQVIDELSKRYLGVNKLEKLNVDESKITFQMTNVVFSLYGEQVSVGVFTTDPYNTSEEINKAQLHRVLVGSFGVYKF
jgi:hypothetical protein